MSKPQCFGDPDLYSSSEAQCRGGYDPVNKTAAGGHTWPKCPWFESCGNVAREIARTSIPASRLAEGPVRSPSVPYASTNRNYPSYSTPSTTAQQQQQQMQRWVPPDGRLSTYLTAEENIERTGYAKGLAAEGVRAGLKGALNQIAFFFDRNPFF